MTPPKTPPGQDWRIASRRRTHYIPPEDLAGDRAFWAMLLDLRTTRPDGLPPHTAAGYRNRRFHIIRHAAWITLYRSATPRPEIGVFLRCTGLAGDAFFALATRERPRLEPGLRAALGEAARLDWGTCLHPGTIDIIARIDAQMPWDEAADQRHTAWLVRAGAAWWTAFASLAGAAPPAPQRADDAKQSAPADPPSP